MITATVEVKKANDKLVATVTYPGGDAEKEIRLQIQKTPPTPTPPAENQRQLNSRLKVIGDQWFERPYIESK